MIRRSNRVSETKDFLPRDENEQQERLREEAERVVSARGWASIQEELGRPALEGHGSPILPYIATSILDLNEGATFESINLKEFCAHHEESLSFQEACRAMKCTTLKTGCSAVDNILGGGICVNGGSILEISGKAGVGKTQLAMQIALMTVAPCEQGGLQSKCIYAFIEGRLPVKRMREIEHAMCTKFGLKSGTLLHGIVVEEVRSADELLVWSETRLPYLLNKIKARVVVIDSIAAVYRPEFQDALSRTRHLAQMSAALKRAVAFVEGVCICVNQVSQKVDGVGFSSIVPALGSVWGNAVETRMFLTRSGSRRFARILDSAHLVDTEEEEYHICAEGVVSTEEG